MGSLKKAAAALTTVGLVVGASMVAGADTITLSKSTVSAAPNGTASFVTYLVADADGCSAGNTNQTNLTVKFTSSNTDVVDAPANVSLVGCDDPSTEAVENGVSVDLTIKSTATSGASSTLTAAALNGEQGIRVGVPPTSDNFDSDTLVVNVTSSNPCDGATAPDAPTFSETGGTAGLAGWWTTAPTVSASSTTAGATITYSDAESGTYGSVVPTLNEGETTIWARATKCNLSSTSSKTYKLDTRAPGITLNNVPTNFVFGFAPSTAPSCSGNDPTPGSGLAGSCLISGWDANATVGSHVVTGTQNDNAGNQGQEQATYTVLAWTLYGFYQPVDMNGVLNTVKAGSTVPLKFEVFAGSTELTSVSAVKSFTSKQVACGDVTSGLSDEIEVTTTGGTTLRYDTTGGQFVQNWQTPKAPNTCYVVTMTTQDGSALSANFKLK